MRRNNKNLNENNNTIKIDGRFFNIQAYFIDLDGTTLDKIKKNISKKNIETLKNKNKTIPIIISTGRAFGKKAKKIMSLIGSKYIICQNGAIIGDSEGNILQEINLKEDQMNKIIEICKKYKVTFTVNGHFEIYTDKKIHFLLRLIFQKHIMKINKFNFKNKPITKIVLVGKTKKKINEIYEEIKDNIPDTSIKTSGHDYIIEITHKNATKGYGALYVCNLLNIDPKNTIHIGDSQNDTTTLGVVGALIAMKNSSKKLFDVATHIGPSYKHGGISKVINGEFKSIERN